MKSKLLNSHGEKTYAIVFDKDDDVLPNLIEFAKTVHLTASHFSGIGALSELMLGFFNRDRRDYDRIPITEQVEVLSLNGFVTLHEDDPLIHAHIVAGRRDGTAIGGHLLGAKVWPTLELVIVETPLHLRRSMDVETGLPLIDIRDPQP